jgi:hypothetical protein
VGIVLYFQLGGKSSNLPTKNEINTMHSIFRHKVPHAAVPRAAVPHATVPRAAVPHAAVEFVCLHFHLFSLKPYKFFMNRLKQ